MNGDDVDDSTKKRDPAVKIACEELRQQLKSCIKESECVRQQHRRAADCVKANDGTVPQQCFVLIDVFSACKRSMFKGRAPFAIVNATSACQYVTN
uniref:Cytochrome c oxidase assembly factor 5 n=1 Tax=Syphacia muris TaxID=451379 RepID=A0A0N5ARW9_9BILA